MNFIIEKGSDTPTGLCVYTSNVESSLYKEIHTIVFDKTGITVADATVVTFGSGDGVSPNHNIGGAYDSDNSNFHIFYSAQESGDITFYDSVVNSSNSFEATNTLYEISGTGALWHIVKGEYIPSEKKIYIVVGSSAGTTVTSGLLSLVALDVMQAFPEYVTQSSYDLITYYQPSSDTAYPDINSVMDIKNGKVYCLTKSLTSATHLVLIVYDMIEKRVIFSSDIGAGGVTYLESAISVSDEFLFYDAHRTGHYDDITKRLLDYRKKVIGFSMENAISGDTFNVATTGSIFVTSGLIGGDVYYLAYDGSFTRERNEYPIGIALSTTELKLI